MLEHVIEGSMWNNYSSNNYSSNLLSNIGQLNSIFFVLLIFYNIQHLFKKFCLQLEGVGRRALRRFHPSIFSLCSLLYLFSSFIYLQIKLQVLKTFVKMSPIRWRKLQVVKQIGQMSCYCKKLKHGGLKIIFWRFTACAMCIVHLCWRNCKFKIKSG